MVGPMINPNKCPTALEGDDGTVHGLNKTRLRPVIVNSLPMFGYLDALDIQNPKGINATGSQNNIAAWNISSIPRREGFD